MINWTENKQPVRIPLRECIFKLGNVRLDIDDQDDGRRWKFLQMSFGSFTSATMEECQTNWPREAIAQARAELDKLEASL